MIKNVLIFRHSDVCHDSLNCFSEIFKEQFEIRGIKVSMISLMDQADEIARQLSELISSVKLDAVVSLNAGAEMDFTSGENNLWDSLQVPFFDYIVDHPLEHNLELNCSCKNCHVIIITLNLSERIMVM